VAESLIDGKIRTRESTHPKKAQQPLGACTPADRMTLTLCWICAGVALDGAGSIPVLHCDRAQGLLFALRAAAVCGASGRFPFPPM